MTVNETVMILDTIALQNKNFKYTNEMLDSWHNVLKDYDYQDVLEMTKLALSEDRFQGQNLPNSYYLVKNLKKVTEKTKLNSYQVYCPICGRLFETYDKQVMHFDRCLSVDYIMREYPKWYPTKVQPSKRELYNMSDSEFKIRYLKLLSHIYKNTASSHEKIILSHVLGLNQGE